MNTLEHEKNSQDVINPESPSQDELLGKIETLEKRYKDLQSYHDKTRVSLERQNAELREKATVFTPPKTPEELETFKTENPDWMGVIETVAHNIASNSLAPIKDELNQSKAEASLAKLQAAHPDLADITASEDFKQWASAQGPEIQAWLEEKYDADKVIRAINYYKAMRQTPTNVPATRNEPSAAQAVSTHGSVVTPNTEEQPQRFSRAQIAKMHPDEYERNYEAIKYAAQNGLLID